jgi:putative intracellular protease/amidase
MNFRHMTIDPYMLIDASIEIGTSTCPIIVVFRGEIVLDMFRQARALITGQKPFSDKAFAAALIAKLKAGPG